MFLLFVSTAVHEHIIYMLLKCPCLSVMQLMNVCTLHSSSDTRMLKIQQYKHKTYGFCTFSCFGPHTWNLLPQDLLKLDQKHSSSHPTTVSIQFLLQSLCVCVWYMCLFFCIILYVNSFGRTVLYMCREYI